MTERESRDLRAMLFGSQIRITNLALLLHKEQEKVQDLINIIDVSLSKGDNS